MPRLSRTAKEVVDDLLAKAIRQGDCLECHLVGSSDRANRERHYVQVGGRNGIKWRTTRLIWHVLKGPIVDGLWVLHRCDNQKCINLDHLFLGTPQDNTDDMVAKGRKVGDPTVGERRRIATATLIKTLREKGYTDERITAEYGISNSTIWNYTGGPYRDTLAIPSGDVHNVRVGLDEPRRF